MKESYKIRFFLGKLFTIHCFKAALQKNMLSCFQQAKTKAALTKKSHEMRWWGKQPWEEWDSSAHLPLASQWMYHLHTVVWYGDHKNWKIINALSVETKGEMVFLIKSKNVKTASMLSLYIQSSPNFSHMEAHLRCSAMTFLSLFVQPSSLKRFLIGKSYYTYIYWDLQKVTDNGPIIGEDTQLFLIPVNTWVPEVMALRSCLTRTQIYPVCSCIAKGGTAQIMCGWCLCDARAAARGVQRLVAHPDGNSGHYIA